MSITTITPRVTYACNNSANEFDFTFKIFSANDLVVTLIDGNNARTVLTNENDYAVTSAVDDNGQYTYQNGGTVTTVATYGNNNSIEIKRSTPIEQEYQSFGSVSADTLETCFDKLTMILQEYDDWAGRIGNIAAPATTTENNFPQWAGNNGVLKDGISLATLVGYIANNHTHNHADLNNAGNNTHAQIDSFISSKASANGLASLDASSKVVQNPANANATPGANQIVMGNATGIIASGWLPDLSGTYATAAKGVTNGDTHDHNGGDGGQISHTSLANIGSNNHNQIDTFIASKASANGIASLNASSLVVQNPANATATPGASKIPISDANSKIDGWVSANAAAGTPSLRVLGTGATDACAGNDSRLTDARTPTAHANTHKSGGNDAIKLDELAAPTDVTTLNANATAHGLLPKLSNNANDFINGAGNWAVPQGNRVGLMPAGDGNATYGANTTVDFANNATQVLALTGNANLTLANMSNGCVYRLNLKQDATGNRVVSWVTTIKWNNNNTVPTLSTAANKEDWVTFIKSNNNIYGAATLDF